MTSLEDYKQRQKDWAERSVTQLSNANNILITISAGLLAFCFEKNTFRSLYLSLDAKVDWALFFYVLSILLLVISIAYGLSVLLSRLYDFRISRHLALTRQRVFKLHSLSLPADDLGPVIFVDRITIIFQIFFVRLPFITKTELVSYSQGGQTEINFNSLRKYSNVLGTCSWIWTKFQILCFVLSIIFYTAHFFAE